MNIPETMQALVLHGKNDLRFEQVPVPGIEADEVLIRIDTCTICGTDPHIINGDFPGFWPKEFPLIPGHEWSGTIVRRGEKAVLFGWQEEDRICGSCHTGCGYCQMCLSGRYNLCLNYGHDELGHRQYGHYLPGAYAQYYRTSIKSIFRLPESIPLNLGACIDPLSVALHTVRRSKLEAGKTLLVNGTGPLGLLAVKLGTAMGAGKIIAAGSGSRLNFAEKLGAVCINYREENIPEKVMEYTGGIGAHSVVESAGTPQSLINACLSAAKGGTVSLLGIPQKDVALPLKQLVLNEVELVGNRANPNCAEDAIQMVAEGRVQLEDILTHEFAMEDFAQAFDTFINRRDNSIKVGIHP